MDPIALENFLHNHIPLSLAMGVRVMSSSPQEVILAAPIKPNINHMHTAFGGSLHALATIACWSLVHNHLVKLDYHCDLVITDSHIKYIAPVTEDFVAISKLDDEKKWRFFEKTLERKGKGRIKLQASIHQNSIPAVEYSGDFAALKTSRTS